MCGTNQRRSLRVTIPFSTERFAAGVRVLTDDEIAGIVDNYAAAARLAHACGYQFVDAKACHGYLGHEMLGATTRPGRLRRTARASPAVHDGDHRGRCAAPLRASALSYAYRIFDVVPHRRASTAWECLSRAPATSRASGLMRDENMNLRAGRGTRAADAPRGTRGEVDLPLGGQSVLQPAHHASGLFPPLDGYEPPEDPLRGVARQIDATAALKARISESDLRRIRLQLSAGMAAERRTARTCATALTDFVGLGRVALSYPELPADVLSGKPLRRAALLPHVQRLHDRAAHGDGLGVLSARSVLRSSARSRAYPDSAGYFAGLNAARLVRSHAASRSAWQLTHAFGLSASPNRSVIPASGMSSISWDRA